MEFKQTLVGEMLNVPVALGHCTSDLFWPIKYDFPILICYTQSNSDDIIVILIYLPYFEFLIVFAGAAIAGRR